MKNKSVSHLVLTGLFVVLVLAASNSIVRAQCTTNTTWILPFPFPGTGDWFTPGNWSNGVSDATVCAHINNGGTAQILGGDAMAKNLFLGDNQGDSGSVTVDGASAGLDVGPSSCRGDIYIGNRGSGNLTIVEGATVRNRYAYIAALQNPTRPNSNGYVNVASTGVQGYAWYLYDNAVDPQCTGAGLFIGCTADSNGAGGNATVNISDGSMIRIVNHSDNPGVMVGFSGTLTGHGVIRMDGSSTVSKTVKVFGTLAPSGGFNPGLRIDGKLDLQLQTNTVFHVNANDCYDTVYVTQNSGEGHAHLDGRVTVIMTGTFTPGASFPLLNAQGGLDGTMFAFESIVSFSPISVCYIPMIQYDANNVYLYLRPTCDEEP